MDILKRIVRRGHLLSDKHSVRYAAYIIYSILGLFQLIFYCILYLKENDYFHFGFYAFVGILLIAGIIFSFKSVRKDFFYTFSVIIILLFSLYLAVIGGDGGSKVYWVFPMPLIIMYMLERKLSLFILAGHFLILCLIIFGHPLFPGFVYSYTPTQSLRIILVYSSVVCLAYFYILLDDMYQKEVELQKEFLTRSNIRLSRMDRMKNEFLGNLTHDFRAPVNIISSLVDMQLEKNDPQSIREGLKAIGATCVKLTKTVDKVLNVVKIAEEGLSLNVSEIYLEQFLSRILEDYRSVADGKHIKLALRCDPKLTFMSDEEKLEQIVNNLLSNSFKFVQQGTGRIQVYCRKSLNSILITVADNGAGIPAGKIDYIFGRYQKISQPEISQNSTGIGLAFSRQLAQFLGGDLSAFSKGLSKGSAFTVELPYRLSLEKSEDPVSDDLSDPVLNLGHQWDSVNSGDLDHQQLHALLIDDEPKDLEKLQRLLSDYPFQTITKAENGLAGLQAIYRERPDIIFCDMNMPDLSGGRILELVSSNPDFSQTPFIFLSVIFNEEISLTQRKKGALAYLKKPVQKEEFSVAVETGIKIAKEFKRLKLQAQRDGLTGLLNKKGLLDFMSRECMCRIYREISVVFCDIDHFKYINDQFGHPFGDKVLKCVGETIKKTLRRHDVIGRFGGEEFVILLLDTDLKNAVVVAEKLQNALAVQDVCAEQKQVHPTLSYGLSSLKDDAATIEKNLKTDLNALFTGQISGKKERINNSELRNMVFPALIELADQALYQAKSTHCLSCGHRSVDDSEFSDRLCPQCGSDNLQIGRNRIVAYSDDIP